MDTEINSVSDSPEKHGKKSLTYLRSARPKISRIYIIVFSNKNANTSNCYSE